MTNRPEGWHTVTPRIFADDPAALVAFLKEVFAATGDLVGDAPAEMWIGDSVVMVSGAEYRAAMAACLYVYADDVDACYARALEAGAESIEQPRDLPYGDRRALVNDRWGNSWQIATGLR